MWIPYIFTYFYKIYLCIIIYFKLKCTTCFYMSVSRFFTQCKNFIFFVSNIFCEKEQNICSNEFWLLLIFSFVKHWKKSYAFKYIAIIIFPQKRFTHILKATKRSSEWKQNVSYFKAYIQDDTNYDLKHHFWNK